MSQQDQLPHIEMTLRADDLIKARPHARRGHQKRRTKTLGETLFDRVGDVLSFQYVRVPTVRDKMPGLMDRRLDPTLPVMARVDEYAGAYHRVIRIEASNL